MNRRTDRAIAISAISAVVLVPTAILAVMKTGGSSPKDPGEMPPAAVAAQNDPTRIGNGGHAPKTPAGPSNPLPGSGAPGGGTGGTGGGGAGGGGKGGGSGSGGGSSKPSGGGAPALTSFTRVTDVRLSGAANGDYEHQRETASFTLAPNFALNAVGVRESMKGGKLVKVTQKVIVSGRTMRGFDGKKWTSSKLTATQLSKLKNESDPRQFTYLVSSVPGVGKSGPDRYGSTHYLAKALMGDVSGRLPKHVAAEVRKILPDGTGVSLDLWSDRSSRPSWIGLNAAAPGASFNGSMTFKSYR